MNYYREVVPYILQWYDYNARLLPWRSEPTPYHVWLSEIMLQQTRVEAVKEYYDRFLKELPSLSDLATVEEERLLKLWEGLGYYSRARNLKKAAQVVMAQYGGELPASYEELRKLPGIGSYTAGAISSIAYGCPEPAVDGNVLRVFSRITGSREDILKETTKQSMREELLREMPLDRPGDYNQALMDLGATICIPNGEPRCADCPVMHLCTAFHEGTTDEIPVKAKKKARRVEKYTLLVLYSKGRYLLHKRSEQGLLAGLWEFPMVEGHASRAKVLTAFCERLGEAKNSEGDDRKTCDPQGIVFTKTSKAISLSPAKHIFSHVEWEMKGFRVEVQEEGFMEHLPEGYVWATREEILERYSVPTAYRAFVPKG